jgi:RimJ/RimL family protein N-acetyltransferase
MSRWAGPPPPRRIVTEQVVLRCWELRDAAALKTAIDDNLEHLRPFIPWAYDEPQDLAQKQELIARFRAEFDAGDDFVYGVFAPDDETVVGGTGLHTRVGPLGLEIGYWVHRRWTRRGIATALSAALTRVAFEHCGADRVEIRIDPANTASLAIPRKLGFAEEATLRRRLPGAPGEPPHDAVVFVLFRDDFERSPAARTDVRAG